MYKVRGGDQKEYGPISATVVREWIGQRRLIASSLAQAEGTNDWKPLSAFPEFAEALSVPPTPPTLPGSMASAVVSGNRPKGLAISSFVLSILGFLTCGITALIGLILGIVSLVRIRKGKASGRGFALSGIILSGLVLLLIPIAVGLLAPRFAKGGSRGPFDSCESNVKQLSLAARMYALDHDGVFPKDVRSLSNGLRSPRVLVCNGDLLKVKADSWSDVGPRNISYEFLLPGRKSDEVAQLPAFRCPTHKHVCLGDGTFIRGKE